MSISFFCLSKKTNLCGLGALCGLKYLLYFISLISKTYPVYPAAEGDHAYLVFFILYFLNVYLVFSLFTELSNYAFIDERPFGIQGDQLPLF